MSETEVNKDIETITSLYRTAYQKALPEFERLSKMQDAYEANLPDTWGTMSEIYLPIIRTAVEQILPDLMDYLFPKAGMFSLVPVKEMTFEAVLKVENYLHDLLIYQMKVKKDALLTLKDCVKFNLGYGIVEPKVITPPTELVNTIFSGAKVMDVYRRMGLGAEKVVADYRYIHWQQIVPSGDGDTPEDNSIMFFMDYIKENELKAMYEADKKLGDNKIYKSSAQEILEATRKDKMDASVYPQYWINAKAAGLNSEIARYSQFKEIRQLAGSEGPVLVPVLKAYFKNRHIWLANGNIIMYDISNEYQTLKCPILKASGTPDSGNYWAKGDVEAGRDPADGVNTITNALMDLLTYYLHPTTIINRASVNDENAAVEPYSVIQAYGDVNSAAGFVQPPALPAGILSIGDTLNQEAGFAVGNPRQLQGAGSAGIMRGGSHTFESFLQTTGARKKMAGSVIETGFLSDLIENTIIMSQLLVDQEEIYIVADKVTNSFIEKTITRDDLAHAFQVRIDLEDKFRKTPADKSFEIMLARDIFLKDPSMDWDAIKSDLVGDPVKYRRFQASPEKAAAQAKQLQAQQSTEGNTSTQGEQALQGGASQISSE